MGFQKLFIFSKDFVNDSTISTGNKFCSTSTLIWLQAGKMNGKRDKNKLGWLLVAVASADLPGDGLGDLPAALLGDRLALLGVGGDGDLGRKIADW